MRLTTVLRFLVLLGLCIMIIPGVLSTTLKGNVYNASLEKISNVVVVVDSDPVQRYVVKNGTYEFELTPGEYELSARSFSDGDVTLGADVKIRIKNEGTFVSDLVLEPINDTPIIDEPKDNGYRKLFQMTDVLLAVGIIIVVIAIVFKLKRRKKNEGGEKFDDNARQILDIVKEEKRITQKELRNRFDLSEAKISLLISELENKGMIKRIKKGRGNILVFNSDRPKSRE